MPLAHDTVELPAVTLIGASIRTSNARAHEIGAFWGKLFAEEHFARIPNKSCEDVYGVYTEYESDHTGEYTLFVGCAVTSTDDVPDGMSVLTLEPGSFARIALPATDPGTVGGTWQQVFTSDIEPRRAYKADFDRYFTPDGAEEQQAEICLSLRSQSG